MTISRDVLAVEAAMQTILDTILDHHTATLTAAWATAWLSVRDELEAVLLDLAGDGDVPGWRVEKSHRAQQGLAATGRALEDLAALTGTTISGDAERVLGLGVDGELAMIGAQLPPGHPMSRADDAQVAAMLGRTMQQITAVSWPISAETDAAIRAELARGMIVGDSPRDAARRMMTATEGRFTGGLARALTISRTEMMSAMRLAQQATDEVNPGVLDGWTWGAHLDSRTCSACISMHGTEWEVTDPGPDGHQNCVLPGAVVSGPAALASTTRWFDGEVIDILTLSGRVLSVTPNHPILTPDRWVPAGELVEGDYVVASTGADGPPVEGSPDDHQVPALIEDVAHTLGGSLPVSAVRVPTAPEDFHGDGSGSQIHVVRTNGLLGRHREALPPESAGEGDLVVGDADLTGFSRGRSSGEVVHGAGHSADGVLGGAYVPGVLFRGAGGHHEPVGVTTSAPRHTCGIEPVVDGSAGYTVSSREGVGRLTGNVPGDDLFAGDAALGGIRRGGLGGTSRVSRGLVSPEATLAEGATKSALADPVPSSGDLATYAGDVFSDRVVDVVRRSWSGHVYNLQTETGWFIANGILTHNCRCARIPRTKSWAALGFPGIPEPDLAFEDAGEWFDGQDETVQRSILGKRGLEQWQAGRFPMSAWAQVKHNHSWRDSYVPAKPPEGS